MKPIPLTDGTRPSVDRQVNNPRLTGGFINAEKEIQLLPHTTLETALTNASAIFQSSFNDRLILVLGNDVFYLEKGALVEVGTMANSTFIPRLAENEQGQVCIVTGVEAWIFNQSANSFFKLNSANNGFDLNYPTDVTSLDTFLIVVGGQEKKWIVSNANDAVTWGANEVIETDVEVGNLIGVESLDNNLYIFGTGGVERWVPSIERVPNSFPFSQDPSYRDEYGCGSTASLISQNNELFYLTPQGQIRRMGMTGRATITNDGIENLINGYQDLNQARGSYFYWKGVYLYQISFTTDKIALIYCSASNTFSESIDMIIGFDTYALKNDGIYTLDTDYTTDYYRLAIQTPYIKPNQSNLPQRVVLNRVLLEMTQGKASNDTKQRCFLSISQDNVLFSNKVWRTFSSTAKRLHQFRWHMNVANTGFCLKFELLTKTDIAIISAWWDIL